MHLFPLYVSGPLLFSGIFLFIFKLNHKKTFKGF
ncbi:hypothetical protein LRR81_12055 [Metabacillus sp. GX 13764]|nr:hypothetical protein [Metabacillus kandeliae]MCD7034982.1 hypothetical protein [Metabacillus kandeliae]